MASEKDMDCGDTTQYIFILARPHQTHGTPTPGGPETNSTWPYECLQIGYTNNKKERKRKIRRRKMECILAEENNSLQKPLPGIL